MLNNTVKNAPPGRVSLCPAALLLIVWEEGRAGNPQRRPGCRARRSPFRPLLGAFAVQGLHQQLDKGEKGDGVVQQMLAGGVADAGQDEHVVGQAGQAGAQAAGFAGALLNILNFVAFIAINLAVMNLLPIPALDGGQILFLVVGGIYHLFTRRRLALKYLSYINMAGFFCLIALMVVVAVSDVFKQF